MRDYFDKITEELLDPVALKASSDPFVSALGGAYERYQAKLFERNRVDFAHLRALVHRLLSDAEIGETVASRVRYVLVDEYQDTNYVQEQVLTMLASATRNICVVGDEDQSLYRFRGATVRNILEASSPTTRRSSASGDRSATCSTVTSSGVARGGLPARCRVRTRAVEDRVHPFDGPRFVRNAGRELPRG